MENWESKLDKHYKDIFNTIKNIFSGLFSFVFIMHIFGYIFLYGYYGVFNAYYILHDVSLLYVGLKGILPSFIVASAFITVYVVLYSKVNIFEHYSFWAYVGNIPIILIGVLLIFEINTFQMTLTYIALAGTSVAFAIAITRHLTRNVVDQIKHNEKRNNAAYYILLEFVMLFVILYLYGVSYGLNNLDPSRTKLNPVKIADEKFNNNYLLLNKGSYLYIFNSTNKSVKIIKSENVVIFEKEPK